MLAFAQGKFGAIEDLEWQVADASALSFSDGSFDAVVCQFGLMFVPDKESAMRECYRILSSGGVFLFNVWDSIEHNPFGQIAHKTIATFFEHDPPNFYELPFSFYDADLIRGLLQRAGFMAIEASLVTLPCRSPSASEFAIWFGPWGSCRNGNPRAQRRRGRCNTRRLRKKSPGVTAPLL
jgi:ubiquinone/menaquinone biosynthesis C-methylase UbiE